MVKPAAPEPKENSAKAIAKGLPISTKVSVEIGNWIRSRTVADAKRMLRQVLAKSHAVPFRVFKAELSHKPGVGPGRYPAKAAAEFIKLLEQAEANAQFKGLNTSNLVIIKLIANMDRRPWRSGRRRRRSKRTMIEIAVKESVQQPKQVKEGSGRKKEEKGKP
ncbi:50S ribosomal protein L22 [Candidatus Woesearchaeota archaeon]|nr:50S ribosomal protein L22 [Candidatus Woesearchaeota archaeon]